MPNNNATNNWDNQNIDRDDNMFINTDNYDVYNSQGVPEALPGTPDIDESGHLVIPSNPWISPGVIENSTMDKDPNNTGPMTDFWSSFPLTIDINGNIFYYDENTGVNLRGPEGAPTYVRWEDLTPEQIQFLKGADGQDGARGIDGNDGADGADGLDAYHAWLRDNDYDEQDHPISEFYSYLMSFCNIPVIEGDGQGSLIINDAANDASNKSLANGQGATAAGQHTSAQGDYSFTSGNNTIANYDYQTVIGQYNLNNQENLFEIGNGSSSQEVGRRNALTVSWMGDVTSMGNIQDGYGNILNNKVDKIDGKGLSTNDFTDSYKSFIDNYTIDAELNSLSTNPVQNRILYLALQDVIGTTSSKPELQDGTDNTNFQLISYKTLGLNKMDIGVKLNNLTFNPTLNSLQAGSNNEITHNYSVGLGYGLNSARSQQFLIGSYNEVNEHDIFQIGNGTTNVQRNNLFTIDENGNVLAAGDITDGDGNILSNKQDILEFDTVPTQDSTNIVNSGNIYSYVTTQIATVDRTTDINSLMTRVSYLENTIIPSLITRIEALENGNILIEDDNDSRIWKLGVNNGELYIQDQADPPTPEPDEDEEGGEDDLNGNND